MMKILLFGSTGLIGSALQHEFAKHSEVILITPSHAECDVRNEQNIEETVKKYKPNVIVNATGYTKVDVAQQEESEKKICYSLNKETPLLLNAAAKNIGALFVHISTDYVFDGTKNTPYTEYDAPCPISVYGTSKYEGEKCIQTNGGHCIIARTAWPFGPGGKNFVDTMLQLSLTNEILRVVDDQIGSPTYTLDFAESLYALIKKGVLGIHHIVNSGEASWYTLAKSIFELLGVPQEIKPITTIDLNRPAPRPKYSVLATTQKMPLRHWKDALAEYLHNKELILKA